MTNTNLNNRALVRQPYSQMPAASTRTTPNQAMPPYRKPQQSGFQMFLDFVQPILLRLVDRKNVCLSFSHTQDQTFWNFSFQEDPLSNYRP